MRIILLLLLYVQISSCSNKITSRDPKSFSLLLHRYYNERMELIPLEATQNGLTEHNDKLFTDFTDSYRVKLKNFFTKYQEELKRFDKNGMNENDRISYDILERETVVYLEGLNAGYFGSYVLYPDHQYTPFNQFAGVPLWLGQLGSGTGSQPFKTTDDYDNWIRRAASFSPWADSAIIYFRKGMAAGIVLPQALVKKMIPQMESMVVTDAEQSLFYGPVKMFPVSFTSEERQKITNDFKQLINVHLVPSYKKLATFLKNEYLPASRTTTGINALANGGKYYTYLIHHFTTTNKTPAEIYQTGLSEVKRINGLIDSVRNAVVFTGSMDEFNVYMRNDPKFMPFKTPEEVLNAYRAIQSRIDPNLKKMFRTVPKMKFEIRQTEAYRAATASAEYNSGSVDGTRPGIFYAPIIDATKYNVTTGMEGLFLHEAIPGHHYQIALQMENDKLPDFRRFAFYGAYVEGWGLYAESLGKELGVYTDPYQYIGALGKEIHRSIRLVVDVGMHHMGMTREEAIKYMMSNMPVNEQRATAEIERYMAVPGQALSYKIGSIKLQELRRRYEQMHGSKFDISAFHEKILEGGSMPLDILERKMDAWGVAVQSGK